MQNGNLDVRYGIYGELINQTCLGEHRWGGKTSNSPAGSFHLSKTTSQKKNRARFCEDSMRGRQSLGKMEGGGFIGHKGLTVTFKGNQGNKTRENSYRGRDPYGRKVRRLIRGQNSYHKALLI